VKQPRKNFAADGGWALRGRQAMDIWTILLRRTGCDRGQRAAARLRCPPPQPSTTCPQPPTIEEEKKEPERQPDDG